MKYYTGVGSRETPDEILEVMIDLASKLSMNGWTLRSGGAPGADTAFEEGHITGRAKEIYLPWNGFEDHWDSDVNHIVAPNLNNWSDAEAIAKQIHPAWGKLKQGAQKLHGRNIYQVLGKDLTTPSKFLVCYAKAGKGGDVQGGTRTAWMCAQNNNIPCFNLYDNVDLERIKQYLEK